MRLNEIFHRILFTLKRRQMDRDLAEEMRQHLELKTRQNIAVGMPEEEARYAAQRQLGNLTRMEEESRQSRGFPFLESLAQDARYGWRGLRKAPGFTAVAVVTLALGIGATTAIFSVVNTVVIRPLPYKDSARLARIHTKLPIFPDFEIGTSKPDFDDLKSGAHSFEALALYRETAMNLTGPGAPEQVSAAAVSSDFLPMFGIAPALGRGLRAEDEQRKDGDVVMLSNRLWRERFASDPNVAGRIVTLEQKPYTIIGVMPNGYDCPNSDDLWLPLIIEKEEARNRSSWFFNLAAKLHPGQTMQSAQTELDGLAARLASQFPKEDAGLVLKLTALQQEIVGDTKSGLLLLLGAVAFLLLIACANVSNLILSRGIQRQGEIAVRAALGASRTRILRQLLVESLLLTGLGGAAGILVAVYGVDAFRALAPENLPRLSELHVDHTIAWVALALASLTGILCGLAPALHTSRPDLNGALKERLSSAADPVRRRFSLRGSLVVIEVALALVLLDGSALMIQSMGRTLSVDTGFRTDHVLTAELNLPKARYATPDARRIFVQKLTDALHANGRLRNSALSDSSALANNLQMMSLDPGMIGDKSATLQMRTVAPGYFETLGIRLIKGRFFQQSDDQAAPRVMIVNEALVRRYFPAQNPLGKVLKLGDKAEDERQIVGIVSDTRDVHLNSAPRPQLYLAMLQNPQPALHIFVRTNADPLALAAELRNAVWSIDKDQPVNRVRSMTEVIAQSVAGARFRTWLLGMFAAVGLTLTLVGIYGVVSYMASQRTREIGIRVALGAPRGNVLRLVLGQGIRLTVGGAIAGVLASLALTRLLNNQLYDIKPSDPATLIAAAVIMLLVALAACYVPARRATRIDPLVALRHE